MIADIIITATVYQSLTHFDNAKMLASNLAHVQRLGMIRIIDKMMQRCDKILEPSTTVPLSTTPLALP